MADRSTNSSESGRFIATPKSTTSVTYRLTGSKRTNKLAYMKQWRLSHKDHIRQYRREHRERINECARLWKKNHPSYYKPYKKRYYEKLKALEKKGISELIEFGFGASTDRQRSETNHSHNQTIAEAPL